MPHYVDAWLSEEYKKKYSEFNLAVYSSETEALKFCANV